MSDILNAFEKVYPFTDCESQKEKDDWYETLGAFTMGWNAREKLTPGDKVPVNDLTEKLLQALLLEFEIMDKSFSPYAEDLNTADDDKVRAVIARTIAELADEDLLHYCTNCSTPLQAVRPGKWQCPNCEGEITP